MALQIEVSKVSVVDAGEKFGGKLLNVTMQLKCWAEGVDTEVVAPVIDQPFSEEYRDKEGLTVIQQVTKTANLIKAEMQKVIDRYNREQALLNNALLDTAVTGIQSGLEG